LGSIVSDISRGRGGRSWWVIDSAGSQRVIWEVVLRIYFELDINILTRNDFPEDPKARLGRLLQCAYDAGRRDLFFSSYAFIQSPWVTEGTRENYIQTAQTVQNLINQIANESDRYLYTDLIYPFNKGFIRFEFPEF
jgi:hypothetical protein